MDVVDKVLNLKCNQLHFTITENLYIIYSPIFIKLDAVLAYPTGWGFGNPMGIEPNPTAKIYQIMMADH